MTTENKSVCTLAVKIKTYVNTQYEGKQNLSHAREDNVSKIDLCVNHIVCGISHKSVHKYHGLCMSNFG